MGVKGVQEWRVAIVLGQRERQESNRRATDRGGNRGENTEAGEPQHRAMAIAQPHTCMIASAKAATTPMFPSYWNTALSIIANPRLFSAGSSLSSTGLDPVFSLKHVRQSALVLVGTRWVAGWRENRRGLT